MGRKLQIKSNEKTVHLEPNNNITICPISTGHDRRVRETLEPGSTWTRGRAVDRRLSTPAKQATMVNGYRSKVHMQFSIVLKF